MLTPIRTRAPDIIAGWALETDISAFTLNEDGQILGYGELWIDDDGAEVELARLIVDPTRRGRGYGRRLTAELVALAQQHHPTVILRLHPDNLAASRCYASAGFVRVDLQTETEWNVAQPIAYRWMTYGSDHRSPTILR